ncbi:ornithine cyclodeaminase family protein [Arthrobacter sp. AZCC_0090]|uniref:ornithine cyclodeaminase family protein n=1 Tax=Arthrobacter sp. AZCC_0090 TaxID=2735881 RepID=UPI0016209FCA|nr:ornithine cyclodeaminase family protein [Arthrobacter sp. AZCC_0090]MBB6404535.1 ornithine cyclodeaminase/alanine dehydrogenase [Arthrobacter sp. AZCC_0090]
MTLILSASDLAASADMGATIRAIEASLADQARGSAAQPGPLSMQLPDTDARYLVMAAASAPQGLVASKLLSDIPDNGKAGLPSQRSSIVLADRATGETLALLDGRVPTRIRTAAMTAVASRHLARPESSILGLVGAGALAVAHVEAMRSVLPIDTVVVWSRTAGTVDAFRREVEHYGIEVVRAATVRDVMGASDVVCTLTPSESPVVLGRWFRGGQHINAVGARPRPDHRELDAEAMSRSRVVVDNLDTALAKSGDLLLAMGEGALSAVDVAGELGQVIIGSIAGREDPSQVTVFNSVGIGLLDLAIGRLLYDAALERGLGVRVDLSA